MKKAFKRVLAFLFAALFLAGALPAGATTQSDVDKLKNQLSSVTSQKNTLKKQLNSIKSQKNTTAKNIQILDRKIEAAENEMELQQQLIEKLNVLVEEKRTELEAGREKLQKQHDDMRARVRFMAEKGNVSYLSILLSADDFSDFLTKYEVIKQITAYDGNMLERYKENVRTVEQQKADLDAALAEAERQEKILKQQKLEYESEIAQREKTLANLVQQEKTAQADYNSIVKEEEELNASIKKLVAQLGASTIYVGGSLQWPLPAANNVVTCKYGMRKHPITKVYKLHTGVDLRATKGTNIYAANSGKVAKSTYSSAYGNYVLIDHGGGVATLYAHMSKRKVSEGQKVKRGDVIGLVGSTGYSTAPHLHFEFIKNGNYTNPLDQFPNFKVVYK